VSATAVAAQLVFGGAPIGNLYREVPDDIARATLEAAWDAGIRVFDTAPHYGLGLSESRIGEFLATRPPGEARITTKVGRLLVANPDSEPGRDLANGFDVPADRIRVFDPSETGIRASLDTSLRRLGVDRVDTLYLHDPDAYDLDRGLAEGLPALERLRAEGLTTRIGIGTNSAEAAARAVRAADLDVVMIAGRYTLLEQPALADLLPLCLERGVEVVAVGVFNSGLLSTSTPGADARYDYGAAPAELLARARRLADVCAEWGVELPVAALRYPLRHPAVAAIAVGAGSPHHITQNAHRFTQDVPEGLWVRLAEEGLIP
jgi:D-threo-aldose 1-dehydrogenase